MFVFYRLLIAFFTIIGMYYLMATLLRRVGKKYKLRSRGTYLYIPYSEDLPIEIIPFEEVIKKEKVVVIVKSDREREDVINDLVERFGTIYKYSFN